MKYTIIAGTNRNGSNTLKVAKQYQDMLIARGIQVQLVSLEGIDLNEKGSYLNKLEEEIFIPTDKFIFVLPEYNGSYPGSLKTMIDMTEIRKVWWGKKALLIGVSTGRAGNLRGMDHCRRVVPAVLRLPRCHAAGRRVVLAADFHPDRARPC